MVQAAVAAATAAAATAAAASAAAGATCIRWQRLHLTKKAVTD
jgi:hypothetical protein